MELDHATWLTLPCSTCGRNVRCCSACGTCAEHHRAEESTLRVEGAVTKVERATDDDGSPLTIVTVKGEKPGA